MVDAEHALVGNDALPVDVDITHRPIGRDVEQASERLAHRHHRWVLDVDQDEVGLGADLEAADIIAQQGAGAAQGAGVEDVERA